MSGDDIIWRSREQLRPRNKDDVAHAPDCDWAPDEDRAHRAPLTLREQQEIMRHDYVEAVWLFQPCNFDRACRGFCPSCMRGKTIPNRSAVIDKRNHSDLSVHVSFGLRRTGEWPHRDDNLDWSGGSLIRLTVSGF